MFPSNRLQVRRVAGTIATWLTGRSDLDWWRDAGSLHETWRKRTEIMAQAIPSGSTVLELGAGDQVLERLLPPACRYYASDLVARTPATVVCDLNVRPLPKLDHLEVTTTVLSGVLEYVRRPREVVDWLAQVAPHCLVSYCPVRVRVPGERAVKALLRAQNGWVNSLTRDELVALFERAGFSGGPFEEWRGHFLCEFRLQKRANAG